MNVRTLLLIAACARVAVAQGVWQLHGADAAVRVVGASTVEMQGPCDVRRELAAGGYKVHFAVHADGKPMSLAFAVGEGDDVHLATARAGVVVAREVPLVGAHWHEAAATDTIRTTGSMTDGDYRLELRVDLAATTTVGLVARWRSADQFYAFVLDGSRQEVRLERRLGSDALVLARADVPTTLAGVHGLALQVQGFRLQASVDEAVVLQVFDGALTQGAFGVVARGDAPQWQRLTVSPPAVAQTSCALVRSRSSATLHAATTVSPGHSHVLELRLDRPHPLVPIDATGQELWLLQRPAAPQVLLADWRGSLGEGSFGEVSRDGAATCQIAWPDLPALRLRVAMVRMLLVTSDGTTIAGATPAVPLRF